jgi:hypothetical protein
MNNKTEIKCQMANEGGCDIIKLPEILWTHFMNSLDYLVSFTYQKPLAGNDSFWINIPNEERVFVSVEELKRSLFMKQKAIIGLDFDLQHPIISDAKYWVLKIEETIEAYNDICTPTESRNIYLFDNKQSVVICYLSESNSILVFGKNKHILLSPFFKEG